LRCHQKKSLKRHHPTSSITAALGLGDSDLIAVKLSMLSGLVWFFCRQIRAR
jgi:hypothetical protein